MVLLTTSAAGSCAPRLPVSASGCGGDAPAARIVPGSSAGRPRRRRCRFPPCRPVRPRPRRRWRRRVQPRRWCRRARPPRRRFRFPPCRCPRRRCPPSAAAPRAAGRGAAAASVAAAARSRRRWIPRRRWCPPRPCRFRRRRRCRPLRRCRRCRARAALPAGRVAGGAAAARARRAAQRTQQHDRGRRLEPEQGRSHHMISVLSRPDPSRDEL